MLSVRKRHRCPDDSHDGSWFKAGDQVITASHTFVATAEAIALLGLTPVFVDVQPDTFTIDLAAIEKSNYPTYPTVSCPFIFTDKVPTWKS